MDNNYQAQSQFASERLDAFREQAQAERHFRKKRSVRMSGLKNFLVRLLRRAGRQDEKKGAEQAPSAALAAAGKGKG